MKKRIVTLLLAMSMVIGIGSSLITPLSAATLPDSQKEDLRNIVENQINATSALGDGLHKEFSKLVTNQAPNLINTYLETIFPDGASLLSIAKAPLANYVGELLMPYIPANLQPYVDTELLISEVFGQQFMQDLADTFVKSDIFKLTIQYAVEDMIAELNYDVFKAAMIDNAVEKIWNNGNPTSTTFGHYNNSTNSWRPVLIGTTLATSLFVNTNAIMENMVTSINPTKIMANALVKALKDTTTTAVNDFTTSLKAKLEKAKADINQWLADKAAELEQLPGQVEEVTRKAFIKGYNELVKAHNKVVGANTAKKIDSDADWTTILRDVDSNLEVLGIEAHIELITLLEKTQNSTNISATRNSSLNQAITRILDKLYTLFPQLTEVNEELITATYQNQVTERSAAFMGSYQYTISDSPKQIQTIFKLDNVRNDKYLVINRTYQGVTNTLTVVKMTSLGEGWYGVQEPMDLDLLANENETATYELCYGLGKSFLKLGTVALNIAALPKQTDPNGSINPVPNGGPIAPAANSTKSNPTTGDSNNLGVLFVAMGLNLGVIFVIYNKKKKYS